MVFGAKPGGVAQSPPGSPAIHPGRPGRTGDSPRGGHGISTRKGPPRADGGLPQSCWRRKRNSGNAPRGRGVAHFYAQVQIRKTGRPAGTGTRLRRTPSSRISRGRPARARIRRRNQQTHPPMKEKPRSAGDPPRASLTMRHSLPAAPQTSFIRAWRRRTPPAPPGKYSGKYSTGSAQGQKSGARQIR